MVSGQFLVTYVACIMLLSDSADTGMSAGSQENLV